MIIRLMSNEELENEFEEDLKENYDEFENIDNFDEGKIWKEGYYFIRY